MGTFHLGCVPLDARNAHEHHLSLFNSLVTWFRRVRTYSASGQLLHHFKFFERTYPCALSSNVFINYHGFFFCIFFLLSTSWPIWTPQI